MRKRMLALLACTYLALGTPAMMTAFALGDDVGTQYTSEQSGQGIQRVPLDSGTQGMTDFVTNYTPVTPEELAEGQAIAEPVAVLIGKLISIGLTIIFAWLFAQTMIDILYLTIPPLQPTLSGMTGGANGKVPRCWITAEAMQAGGQAQQGMMGNRGGMGMRGGFGGGMGMNGGMGMGMGGMGGMNRQQQSQTSSNILLTYLKSRTVTFVLMGVCAVLLFSNIFLGLGTVVGGWIYSLCVWIMQMMS